MPSRCSSWWALLLLAVWSSAVRAQDPLQGTAASDSTDASGFPVHILHETIWWMDINFDPGAGCSTSATVLVKLSITDHPQGEMMWVTYTGHDSLLISEVGGLTLLLGDSAVELRDTSQVTRASVKGRLGLRVAEAASYNLPSGTLERMADAATAQLRLTGAKGSCEARLNPSDRHWVRQLLQVAGVHGHQ